MVTMKDSIPKELQQKVLELIEKSRKTGKVRVGVNEVTKMIERNQAKFVAIAQDVTPAEIVLHLPAICKEKNIPFGFVSSKKELGEKAGLKVGTSALAIVEEGEHKKEFEALGKKFAEM
ncbi:MAG: 50S ribosomal protein L7Ae [Candidatus Micrarchaeota archaeon]